MHEWVNVLCITTPHWFFVFSAHASVHWAYVAQQHLAQKEAKYTYKFNIIIMYQAKKYKNIFQDFFTPQILGSEKLKLDF